MKKLANKNTKIVDLSFNKINNLEALKDENNNLKGLEAFFLNNNEIKDISIFKIDNIFPELKILNVSNNKINKELDHTKKLLKDLEEKLILFKYKKIMNITHNISINYSKINHNKYIFDNED